MIEKIHAALQALPRHCPKPRDYYIYEDFFPYDYEELVNALFAAFYHRLPTPDELAHYLALRARTTKSDLITQVYAHAPNPPRLLGYKKRRLFYRLLHLLRLTPLYAAMRELPLLHAHIQAQQHTIRKQASTIETYRTSQTALSHQLQTLAKELDQLRQKPTLPPHHLQPLPDYITQAHKECAKMGYMLDDDFSSFYLLFESIFYNSDAVTAHQKRYLDYIAPDGKVLDLGCGRGEWLEILRAHGIEAIGVDTNPHNIQRLASRGFTVVGEDAISFLQKDSSTYSTITALELIEHMEFEEIVELSQLAHQHLTPGGVLIYETVNPLATTGIGNFYMDITHKRPLPPYLVAFLLQYVGFSDCKLLFSSPVPPEFATSFMDKNYQTYAIIARKGK